MRTKFSEVDQHVYHKQPVVWLILGHWVQPQVKLLGRGDGGREGGREGRFKELLWGGGRGGDSLPPQMNFS